MTGVDRGMKIITHRLVIGRRRRPRFAVVTVTKYYKMQNLFNDEDVRNGESLLNREMQLMSVIEI